MNKLAVEVDALGGDGAVGADGEGGEGLDWEGWVALGARSDESCSNGVDLAEVEWGVLWAGPSRVLGDGRAEPSLVSGLGGEDRSGNGHVGGLGDRGGGTEVGGDTDVLDEGSGSEEAVDIGHAVKVVGAWLGGSGAEGSGEEGDVLSCKEDLGCQRSSLPWRWETYLRARPPARYAL